MTPQEMENGRRNIARECLKELKKTPNLNDTQTAVILDKYTPRFKPLNHMRFSTKSVLGYYMRIIQKEMRDG